MDQEPEIDFIVRGEGEETVVRIIVIIAGSTAFGARGGIATR